MCRDRLDAALIAAHAAGDGVELVRLYTEAADRAADRAVDGAGDRVGDRAADLDAECFYLTHAYVFALETGAQEADILHARLKAHGREE